MSVGLTRDPVALNAFWAVFHVRSGERRCAHRTRYSRWAPTGRPDLFVSEYVTARSVGVFLRGPLRETWRVTARRLEVDRDRIEDALDACMGEQCLFLTRWAVDTGYAAHWLPMADWLHAAADRYAAALARCGLTAAPPNP